MSISDFSGMLTNTITVYEVTGRDKYGKPTYSTGTEYSCRITYKDKLVTSAEGKEVVAKGNIIVAGTAKIDTTSKVTLDDGTEPKVITTTKVFDENGVHHTRIFFS